MRTKRIIAVLLAAALCVLGLVASAAATPLAPNPALDQTGKGLSIAEAGVGLGPDAIGPGTKNITISIGGPVQAAYLYWAGRQFTCGSPCPQTGRDQQLVFDGNAITGTLTGSEPEGQSWQIGYRADVTSIVTAKGSGTYTIADGNLANNLDHPDGAGLFVIYKDLSDPNTYRVIVYDGLDFAFWNDSTPEGRTTSPVTFNHGATATSRNAQVIVFAGDPKAPRPDRITINSATFNNQLDSSDGPEWDTDSFSITVPANLASTTVQLFSDAIDPVPPPGLRSDSLLWQLGALRIPVPGGTSGGCTPGYWKNHHNSWAGTGYTPTQKVNTVFTVPPALATQGNATLDQALAFSGGGGTTGAAQILLRAATASLLNSATSAVSFSQSTSQIISSVNAALASNNRTTMLNLATQLDTANNGRCTLT